MVAGWESSPIAFLGNPIHASPVDGTGANAALEDAAILSTHLTSGKLPLQYAVDEYETSYSSACVPCAQG